MRYVSGLLVLFGSVTGLQAQEIQGGYVGVSVGYFDYEESASQFAPPLTDTTNGLRVFGGYQFNSYYAIEAGWFAATGIGQEFRATDPVFGNVSLDLDGEFDIATLRFLAMAPLQSTTIYGGAGYFDAKRRVDLQYRDNFQTLSLSDSSTDSGATVVGGVVFELRKVAIRTEYEWFDADGIDVSNISVGVLYRF